MIQYSINLLKRLNRLVSPVPVYVNYFSQTNSVISYSFLSRSAECLSQTISSPGKGKQLTYLADAKRHISEE